METIQKDTLLKFLRKNSLTGIIINIAIWTVITAFAVFLFLEKNTLLGICLTVFDIPITILALKLITSYFKIKLDNISIVKDKLINKSNRQNVEGNYNAGMFQFFGEYEKLGKISLSEVSYKESEIDQYYYLVFIKGQEIPVAVYATAKYKLDKDLKKQITKSN